MQDIQFDHLTMIVYNTLTTHVIFDQLDHDKFEVAHPSRDIDEDDDNSDDMDDIL